MSDPHRQEIVRLRAELTRLQTSVANRQIRPAAPAQMAANLVLQVEAPAHGLSARTVLAWDGAYWILADSTAITPATLLGVIGEIVDANSYRLVIWGKYAFATLTMGSYWLSQTTPGALTSTEPTTAPTLILQCLQHDGLSLVGPSFEAEGMPDFDARSIAANNTDEADAPSFVAYGAYELPYADSEGDLLFGKDPIIGGPFLSTSSTPGTLTIVVTSDGDGYVVDDEGISGFDRSRSDDAQFSLNLDDIDRTFNSTTKIKFRELNVVDSTGAAKKIVIPASAAY